MDSKCNKRQAGAAINGEWGGAGTEGVVLVEDKIFGFPILLFFNLYL